MIKITFNSKKAFIAIFGFLILSFFTVSKANAEELKVSERGDGYQTAESSSDSVQPAEDVIYGERLRTDSAISVGRASYFYEGFHTRGVIFANNTIVNNSLNSNGISDVPVTIGDDLRIDGEIWRGTSKGTSDNQPLKFSDTMVPTMTNINDIGDSSRYWRNGYFSGAVTVGDLEGANIINEENLNVTNSATSGQVLSYSQDGQFTWIPITGSSDSDGDGTTDGILPAGTSGQTLRYGASGWEASSLIYNDGTDIDIGGGFGDSGLTVTNAGALQMNAGLTVDGSAYIGDVLNVVGISYLRGNTLIGGGYGSTGVTMYDTGALSMDGELKIGAGYSPAVGWFIPGVTIYNGNISTNTDLVVDGKSELGGGYGSAGVTIENTGDLNMDSDLTVGPATGDNYGSNVPTATIKDTAWFRIEPRDVVDNNDPNSDSSMASECDEEGDEGRIMYWRSGTDSSYTGHWGCRRSNIVDPPTYEWKELYFAGGGI